MGGLKSKVKRSRSKERKDGKKSNKRNVDLPVSSSAKKTVDPRLPFSNYRQIFNIRNQWKAILRKWEDTAKENLIRFFQTFPNHREAFPKIKGITAEEEMRSNQDFEDTALDIFSVFDKVIEYLEDVDSAIQTIASSGPSAGLTEQIIQDMRGPFMETLKTTLGSDRFTEATEENFKLLYDFVQSELLKSLHS
ncbi:hypothetical protein CHS0354_032521 [Potamilus streckersoni]|uniref:Globin domain-containing protein n=1 Tax=Potamilus streckersoni TaxID=2493646 RepID=A0AAE0SR11_9BIVA|nr:hypothetical protein CHS0354_032521 [Potamilus streckersoni]